jgi:hypothetical protein
MYATLLNSRSPSYQWVRISAGEKSKAWVLCLQRQRYPNCQADCCRSVCASVRCLALHLCSSVGRSHFWESRENCWSEVRNGGDILGVKWNLSQTEIRYNGNLVFWEKFYNPEDPTSSSCLERERACCNGNVPAATGKFPLPCGFVVGRFRCVNDGMISCR